MKPFRHDISGYAGDTYQETFKFEDKDGAALPLPVEGWKSQIKSDPFSNVVIAEIEVDASNAANGEIGITIPSTVTANLSQQVWDLQCDNVVVRTYIAGTLTFDKDTTR